MSFVLALKVLFIYSNYIWLFQLLVACFVIAAGTYWLFSKPIAVTYGRHKKIVDNLMGTLFIIIGLALMVFRK
jgi:threonine/homoserine/homoserine lactone efflux protein